MKVPEMYYLQAVNSLLMFSLLFAFSKVFFLYWIKLEHIIIKTIIMIKIIISQFFFLKHFEVAW